MNYPRVFAFKNDHLEQQDNWSRNSVDAANVLIVCGQGVYEDGTYYGEFHDRDVYLEHAIMFPEIVQKFNFNTVVLSGGFTQNCAPWLSEAESFLRILDDTQVTPPTVPIILDECALDSAENLILGLMTARLALGETPIRRIGIWAAWKFKKWRFNRNAEALGIVEQTYVYGLAPSRDTNIQVPPEDQTQKTFNEYKEDSVEYLLLRAKDKEDKRQKRWQNNRIDMERNNGIDLVQGEKKLWNRSFMEDGTPQMLYNGEFCSLYKNRYSMFSKFSDTLNCLKMIEKGLNPDEVGLKAVWHKEIMKT